jgi:hypothetical protein
MSFTEQEQQLAEALRMQRLAEINSKKADRAALEAEYGQVWDSNELGHDFNIKGFMAPFVVVARKADGVVGSLEFQHMPRFYFNFTEDK